VVLSTHKHPHLTPGGRQFLHLRSNALAGCSIKERTSLPLFAERASGRAHRPESDGAPGGERTTHTSAGLLGATRTAPRKDGSASTRYRLVVGMESAVPTTSVAWMASAPRVSRARHQPWRKQALATESLPIVLEKLAPACLQAGFAVRVIHPAQAPHAREHGCDGCTHWRSGLRHRPLSGRRACSTSLGLSRTTRVQWNWTPCWRQ
jgi:hypothetical protein